MAGKSVAVKSGDDLVKAVVVLAKDLGLEAEEQVQVARRIWGAKRKIDIVITHPETHKALGVECKAQKEGGSAEEKIPATIKDMEAWPIPGIVVFAGAGFTENMKSYLVSTGKAIEFDELESWLRLFFGLSIKK